jgi:hypothetical protein
VPGVLHPRLAAKHVAIEHDGLCEIGKRRSGIRHREPGLKVAGIEFERGAKRCERLPRLVETQVLKAEEKLWCEEFRFQPGCLIERVKGVLMTIQLVKDEPLVGPDFRNPAVDRKDLVVSLECLDKVAALLGLSRLPKKRRDIVRCGREHAEQQNRGDHGCANSAAGAAWLSRAARFRKRANCTPAFCASPRSL